MQVRVRRSGNDDIAWVEVGIADGEMGEDWVARGANVSEDAMRGSRRGLTGLLVLVGCPPKELEWQQLTELLQINFSFRLLLRGLLRYFLQLLVSNKKGKE